MIIVRTVNELSTELLKAKIENKRALKLKCDGIGFSAVMKCVNTTLGNCNLSSDIHGINVFTIDIDL